MKQLFLVSLLLICYNNLRAQDDYDGSVLFSISQIQNISKVAILDRIVINNNDTCKNGKVLNEPSTYTYKCRITENIYGNETDSIINATFSFPQPYDYDNDCNIIASYSYIGGYSGLETKLNIGDSAYLCYDESHQIAVVIKSIIGINKFTIDNIKALKKIDRTVCRGESMHLIGTTKSSELCILHFSYDPTLKEDIQVIFCYNNGIISRYETSPNRELHNRKPNIVWNYEIDAQKIIVYNKHERYELQIIR